MFVKAEMAEEKTEDQTMVYMIAAREKWGKQGKTKVLPERLEESLKHTEGSKPREKNFPGEKISSFK